MKRYFVLDSNPYDSSCIMRIEVPECFNVNMRALYFGEVQYFNEDEAFLFLIRRTEELPDIYNYDFPLFSGRLKNALEDCGVQNILYKPVYLVEKGKDKMFDFYVPLVRQINCVLWDKSIYEGDREDKMKAITGEFHIDSSKVGNYKLFKIKDALNDVWIIDESMKEKLEEIQVKGATMVETCFYKG